MISQDDRFAIEQAKFRYLRGVDTKSWDLVEAFFAPHATAVYSGGAYSFNSRSDILAFLRRNLADAGFHSSHQVHHGEFEESDTHITVRWSFQDVNVDTTRDFLLFGAGHYLDEFERDSEGHWRCRHIGYSRTYEIVQQFSTSAFELSASAWRTDGMSRLKVE